MTYPLIGNYGRIRADDQSERPWLRALVVATATAAVVEQAGQLAALLRGEGIPAIAGIDTRALARHLRTHGCLRGLVTAPGEVDPDGRGRPRARRAALGGPGLRGGRLADGPVRGRRRRRRSRTRPSSRSSTSASRRTSCAACGGAASGCASCPTRPRRATCWPRTSPASCSRPDPAIRPAWPDPWPWPRAIIADGRPLLGICLGHQLVGRAAGAETRRLRFGHHGANHPVQDAESGRVQVTAQNHEVTVDGGDAAAGERVRRQPGEPQRRLRGGAAPPEPPDRDRPVPPRGRAGAARRPGRLRPVRGRGTRRAEARG